MFSVAVVETVRVWLLKAHLALASDLRFEEEGGIPRKYGDGGVSLVEKLKGLHKGTDVRV